jgi:hypothetical protein
LRTALALVTVLGALVALTVPAAGSAAVRIQVCGQKRGPSTSWSTSLPGIGTYRFKGSTWTVFATGGPCASALAAAPGLLRQWPKTAIGKRLTLKGWVCTKTRNTAYSGKGSSSGGIVCAARPAKSIDVLMLAPYTLAQIRQVAATGQLPK